MSSVKWSVQDALDFVKEMFVKHLGNSRFWPSKAWIGAMDRVLGQCDSLNMDPECFIEAQFVMLRAFINSTGTLYPNCFSGPKAIQRYDWFRARNRRQTLNSKTQLTDVAALTAAIEPEVAYGEYMVRCRQFALDTKGLEETVRAAYPGWCANDAGKVFARRQALAIVADSFVPGLSKQVAVTRDFTWEEAAEMILQMVPPSTHSSVPDGVDGYTLGSASWH